LWVEARDSTLNELDAIAERVVDIAATDFGNLVVESYLVTCRAQRPKQVIEVLHDYCWMGLSRGPETLFDPEVERDAPVREPAAPASFERRGLLLAL
jgi:hypothetical protein